MRVPKRCGRMIGSAAASGLLALVLLAIPAAAVAGSIAVSPSTVTVGQTVTISGSLSIAACPSGDGVTITSTTGLFPAAGFGPTVSRNASGAFAVNYSLPLSTPPGTYSVGMRCGGGNPGVAAQLRVVAQVSQVPVHAPQAGLGGASTADSNAAGWSAAGAASLLVFGLLLLLIIVRRRHRVA